MSERNAFTREPPSKQKTTQKEERYFFVVSDKKLFVKEGNIFASSKKEATEYLREKYHSPLTLRVSKVPPPLMVDDHRSTRQFVHWGLRQPPIKAKPATLTVHPVSGIRSERKPIPKEALRAAEQASGKFHRVPKLYVWSSDKDTKNKGRAMSHVWTTHDTSKAPRRQAVISMPKSVYRDKALRNIIITHELVEVHEGSHGKAMKAEKSLLKKYGFKSRPHFKQKMDERYENE